MSIKLVEDYKMEFKRCSQGRLPSTLVVTISAFANSEGGRILCGVDNQGRPLNLSRQALAKLQVAIASQCRRAFNVTINPEIRRRHQHLVVVIYPAAAHQRPVYIKKRGLQKGSYIRVGAANHVASEQILKSLIMAASGGAEQNQISNQRYTNCFDLDQVKAYLKILNRASEFMYQDFKMVEVLLKLKAINDQQEPTVFGLLAFGKSNAVQEILSPALRVEVTTYSGLNKTNSQALAETFLSSKSFKGNLEQQFQQALSYIMLLMPNWGVIDTSTGVRQDISRIPEVAIREALINSLIHRDYAIYGAKIDVDVYANRLEIINPGISLVPLNQLETASSLTRNPSLMSFGKDLGLVEEKARGIRTIKAALRQANLKPPLFENLFGQFFKVTLYNSLLVAPQDMTWLSRLADQQLTQNQIKALVYLKNQPQRPLTNSRYRQLNNLKAINDDYRARKELAELVAKRLLRAVGSGKARHYVLTSRVAKLIRRDSNSA